MKNRVIAVTGGIGSGKSTALKILSDKGYKVVSCDEINRSVYEIPQVKEKLKEIFPSAEDGGELNKKEISAIVFSDKEKRKALENLLHPIIVSEAFLEAENCDSKDGTAFVEVPLLFGSGYENKFDKTLVIIRNLEDRIKSVMKRSGLSRREVEARINAQFDYDKLGDCVKLGEGRYHVIRNDKTLCDLEKGIDLFLTSLREEKYRGATGCESRRRK